MQTSAGGVDYTIQQLNIVNAIVATSSGPDSYRDCIEKH
jgi:hypothetical protein